LVGNSQARKTSGGRYSWPRGGGQGDG
jgi:hypothetical protein